MTLTYVLMQNLKRNRLRTGLTAVAFALPMAIFVLALSLVVGLTRTAEALQKELRLGVTHRIALVNLLPDGLRRKIEELDGKHERWAAVCGMRWFGGRVPGTQNTLQSLAADRDTFPIVYSDVRLTPAELELWNRERRALVAAAGTANQYGWKVGERVVLESTVPPYLQLEFVVIKVWYDSPFPSMVYFRRDYLVDSLEAAGTPGTGCNIFWIKCTSAAALRSLQREIDQTFANTPDATKSEDENAFIAGFVQAIGDLPGLAKAMAVVVMFVIALVAGNTMMMSFRERLQEIAIFKAIGFQPPRVFLIVLSESLLLALLGSLLGIVPVSVALELLPERVLRWGAFSAPELSVFAVVHSLLIGLGLGAAAGAWPAYQALRLRTVDALRRVA